MGSSRLGHIAVAAFGLVGLLLHAQATGQSSQGHWLIGVWEGDIQAPMPNPRRIIAVRTVASDGTAEGKMGIAGQPLGPAEIKVEGVRVLVVNAIKSVVELTREGDNRLVGTITGKDGRASPFALTRVTSEGHPLIGEWQGTWVNREGTRSGRYYLTVTHVSGGKAYVDIQSASPASHTYRASALGTIEGTNLAWGSTDRRTDLTFDGNRMWGTAYPPPTASGSSSP